ncbi:MAG: beta-propeller domain-containing protein [Propionibacteriaceae bacterium]|nr:beta-propeller domain-containing protein [Propionibacteriaceae bacterium]
MRPTSGDVTLSLAESASDKAHEGSYTATNVQVSGIDEGDFVKTDGKSIFIASGNSVQVVQPAGAATKLLSRFSIAGDKDNPGTITDLMLYNSTLVVLYQRYELRPLEDVIQNGNYNPTYTEYVPYDAKDIQTLLYDVSSPAAPRLMTSFEQSGIYNTSRLTDNLLYLVSSYQVNPQKIDAASPQTFVPATGKDGNLSPMPIKDIGQVPTPSSPSYTVVTAIDLTSQQLIGQQSVLGSSETVYMSSDNIFLASFVHNAPVKPLPETTIEPRVIEPGGEQYASDEAPLDAPGAQTLPSEPVPVTPTPVPGGETDPEADVVPPPPTPDVSDTPSAEPTPTPEPVETPAPTVEPTPAEPTAEPTLSAEPTLEPSASSEPAPTQKPVEPTTMPSETPKTVTGPATHLIRIALADGALQLAAQADIAGSLLNQFSLDEHKGHLRVVTTVEDQQTWQPKASLWVLDENLQRIGEIATLVKNESVQSVRFAGNVGYVVTYRQVDPLFTIDLSNPKQPKVLSALKIPGFSTYLHPYANGLLLGLGVNADSVGNTSGLKLSMFDVSDPYNVKEKHTQEIPFWSAEALHEHKAVLVDPSRGLIGFNTNERAIYYMKDEAGWDDLSPLSYLIFNYDAKQGFSLSKEIPRDYDRHNVPTRGMIIDNSLYVTTHDHIWSYDLAKFNELTTMDLKK